MSTGMSTAQVQVINPVLTRYLQEAIVLQDPTMYTWNLVAPVVTVPQTIGQSIEFGLDAFRLYNSSRAPGANTKRVGFGYAGKSYSLQNKRLEGLLPKEHLRDAKATIGIDLQKRAANVPLRSLNLELEYEVWTAAGTAANYPAGHAPAIANDDKWNAANVSIIEQVRAAKRFLAGKIGPWANFLTLFLSPQAKDALRDAPEMVTRVQYTQARVVTEELMASVLDVRRVVEVSATYVDDAGAWNYVFGNKALLAYVPDMAMAAWEIPAFMYTYVMEGHPMAEMPYEDRNANSWAFPVAFERGPQIVGGISGYLFDAVTA